MPRIVQYIRKSLIDWYNSYNVEEIKWWVLTEIAIDDNGTSGYKKSSVMKRLEKTQNRFLSMSCTFADVNFKEGTFDMWFRIRYNINFKDKRELSQDILNDVINVLSIILEYHNVVCNDLENYILIELRKDRLSIRLALNNTGLSIIKKKGDFIDQNFDRIKNL
ncbi:hypothetical protein ACSXCI_01975 [Clostridium perfringens]